MADLAVEVCGLRLRNPTMLAAGVLDETGRSMLEVAKAGAGAIVTKSIGREPREGHAGPCVVELDYGLLNAMGLPNPGMRLYSEEIRTAKKARIPIIGSVFGSTASEIAELAALMESSGVDAVELNLSCPHAEGYGAELGSTPEMVEQVCCEARRRTDIPLLAKLTPNTSSIAELAKAAERGKADAIVAINTLKGMAIDPETRRPILGNRFGGLSGPAVKPVGVRCVYEIFEAVRIPVIGAGGIGCGRDAIEYIMAGARAVQIGTAVWTHGPGVFGKVSKEIGQFMSSNGFRSVEELVGVAHPGQH
ncbi:MAG TPA: dihydroorotate dehydrogenase [Thermoplasmata archaeon]